MNALNDDMHWCNERYGTCMCVHVGASRAQEGTFTTALRRHQRAPRNKNARNVLHQLLNFVIKIDMAVQLMHYSNQMSPQEVATRRPRFRWRRLQNGHSDRTLQSPKLVSCLIYGRQVPSYRHARDDKANDTTNRARFQISI